MNTKAPGDIAAEIADQVVPAYRSSPNLCTSQIGKRWSAAHDAASIGLSYPRAAFGGEATQAQGWQDSSTAPKDGTIFLAYWSIGLLYKKGFIQPMKWCFEREKFVIEWDHDDGVSPEYWIPMPAPPAALIPNAEGGA